MLLPRQHATSISVPSSTSSSAIGFSAADLIQQAENHWDVSAESILAAWVVSIICVLVILLLYSTVRVRWDRIYVPRWKLRKPPQTLAEKSEEQLMKAQLSTKHYKEWKLAKFDEEPEYYPGFTKHKIETEGVEWREDDDDGIWAGRVPKLPITFFGWIKPSWDDTVTEVMSIIPHWFCCCWSFLGLRFCVTKRGQKKRQTILDLDVKLMKMLGLDAVLYLMFLRLMKYLFTAISLLATLLVFANYYINTETEYGSTSASSLGTKTKGASNNDDKAKSDGNTTNIVYNPNLVTAANITSNGLWVHISFEIIVTMLVIIFVLKACTHHMRLVQEWHKMNCNEISFKTLFITGLSITKSTNGQAKRKIRDLILDDNVDNIDSEVWFAVHRMNALEKKIEKYKENAFKNAIHAIALETYYEDQPNKNNYVYDSCWDRIHCRRKNAAIKVEEALAEKHQIEVMQNKIRHEQDGSNGTDISGTVTAAFVTLPSAVLAKKILADRKHKLSEAGYKLEKAPRTHNVLWKNLEKDAKSRRRHGMIGTVALLLVGAFNTIPVMFIVFFTDIGNYIDKWPALAELQNKSQFWKVMFMILEGVLPATVAAIFAILLPYVMRELNRWSGSITRGHLDKYQIKQVFIFMLVSNFVVFALFGVFYETAWDMWSKRGEKSMSEIYASLGDLAAKITRAYISQSLYWFSWYPIRSIVMWLQLLQLPRLIFRLPQIIRFKTPEHLAEITLAIHFEFALEYSLLIFAACVGLVYAPLAPIVVYGAALHFWSAHIVHSQSLKYVNDAKETDGECWWPIINRLLFGTFLMQCLMVLTVTLKTSSPSMAVSAALPIFLIYLFKLYLKKHYDSDGLIKASSHIESYNEKERHCGKVLDRYVPDVLQEDWMPAGKTVKNKKLMKRAIERIPDLRELVGYGRFYRRAEYVQESEKLPESDKTSLVKDSTSYTLVNDDTSQTSVDDKVSQALKDSYKKIPK